jgi:hypothetical protein
MEKKPASVFHGLGDRKHYHGIRVKAKRRSGLKEIDGHQRQDDAKLDLHNVGFRRSGLADV